MTRLAVALIAMAACNSPEGPPGAGSATEPPLPASVDVLRTGSATTVRLPEPAIPLPRQLGFDLVGAGSGARAPLRYALAPAVMDYGVETRLTSRRLEGGAWTERTAQPPLRDGFAITPGDKGFLALRALPAAIVGAETPEAKAYAATWTSLLAKRRLTANLDDRGQLEAVALADDPNGAQGPAARDEAIQRLLGTLVPVPAEPVGVGATWRVTIALRQGLAIVKQTATYTLTARTPTEWKLHALIRRDAEEQTVTDPSLPAGAVADLVAIVRTLEGDLTIAPTQPLGAGTLTIDSHVHLRITPPHQAQVEQILEDTGTLTLTVAPE